MPRPTTASEVLPDRGLLRLVTHQVVHRSGLARGDLLELTDAGLRTLAGTWDCRWPAQSRITAWRAGRQPETPPRGRRILSAHLTHTVGADAIFGTLAHAARARSGGALVAWRNAAACAHGRLRPDRYGVLRLGRREYGFFLEFDRGTVRSASLRAKFVAHHRYLASARAAHNYEDRRASLVVTAGPGAEDRIAAAAAGQPLRRAAAGVAPHQGGPSGHGRLRSLSRAGAPAAARM